MDARLLATSAACDYDGAFGGADRSRGSGVACRAIGGGRGMEMDEQRERCRALFSGRVQGVGFRFRTLAISRQYPGITGFVRNLPDGRVELVVEGDSRDTRDFIAAVKETMAAYISDVELSCSAATSDFEAFEIRY